MEFSYQTVRCQYDLFKKWATKENIKCLLKGKRPKGPSIKNVRKILVFFDLLPLYALKIDLYYEIYATSLTLYAFP